MSSDCCADNNCGMNVQVLCLSQQDGLMQIDVTGVTATISISVPGGGVYRYWLMLSDSNDPDQAVETLNKPTSGATVSWTGRTDANGNVTRQFENTGAVRTWYAWLELLKTNVSDAITVGV